MQNLQMKLTLSLIQKICIFIVLFFFLQISSFAIISMKQFIIHRRICLYFITIITAMNSSEINAFALCSGYDSVCYCDVCSHDWFCIRIEFEIRCLSRWLNQIKWLKKMSSSKDWNEYVTYWSMWFYAWPHR